MKANYQTRFLDAILGSKPDQGLLDLIRPAGTLSQQQALDVYKGDYSARMQEALGKNYEATWVLMGDDDFIDISRKYIDAHPSTFTNLTAYGDSFPDLLSEYYEDGVVIMARFEKIFWKLFNRKSNPALTILPDELAGIHFNLSESIYLFEASYKLYELWQIREQANSELSFEDFEGDQFLAVFKEGEKVGIRDISLTQYTMLKCFHECGILELSLSGIEALKMEPSAADWAQVFEILSYSNRKNG